MSQTLKRRSQHHFASDRAWHEALEYALEPEGTPPYAHWQWPSIRVLSVSDSGHRFEIEMRFRTGDLYCCEGAHCFLSTYSKSWWTKFRARLAQVTDREPPPMVMQIHAVIEEGAMFEVNVELGLPLEARHYAASYPADHERKAH